MSGSKDNNRDVQKLQKAIGKNLREKVQDELGKEVNRSCRSQTRGAAWFPFTKQENCQVSLDLLRQAGPAIVMNENMKKKESANDNHPLKRSCTEPLVTEQWSENKRATLLTELNPLRYSMFAKNQLDAPKNCIPQPQSLLPSSCQYKSSVEEIVEEDILLCDDKEIVEYLREVAKNEANVIDEKFDLHNFNSCDNDIVQPYYAVDKQQSEVLENIIGLAVQLKTATGAGKESLPSVAAVKEVEETRASLVQALMKPLKALPRLFITKDGVYMRRRIKVSKLTRDIRARMRQRAEQTRQDLIPDSSDEN